MIPYVLVGAAALAALAWVLAPFLRNGERNDHDGDVELQDAEERKSAALGAILDLENERAAGKLADEDHDALRLEYEGLAARAMQDIERASSRRDDPIEAEIAAARALLTCERCGARKPRNAACPRCAA